MEILGENKQKREREKKRRNKQICGEIDEYKKRQMDSPNMVKMIKAVG